MREKIKIKISKIEKNRKKKVRTYASGLICINKIVVSDYSSRGKKGENPTYAQIRFAKFSILIVREKSP